MPRCLAAAGFAACVLFAASAPALAASFDCSRAATAVEHTICEDRTLSALDDEMALDYRAALKRTSGAAKSGIRSEQKTWLRQRNACASDASCIDTAYRVRIQRLGEGGIMARVTPPAPETPALKTTEPKSPGILRKVWSALTPDRNEFQQNPAADKTRQSEAMRNEPPTAAPKERQLPYALHEEPRQPAATVEPERALTPKEPQRAAVPDEPQPATVPEEPQQAAAPAEPEPPRIVGEEPRVVIVKPRIVRKDQPTAPMDASLPSAFVNTAPAGVTPATSAAPDATPAAALSEKPVAPSANAPAIRAYAEPDSPIRQELKSRFDAAYGPQLREAPAAMPRESKRAFDARRFDAFDDPPDGRG